MAVQTIMFVAVYFGEKEINWGSTSAKFTGLVLSILLIQIVAIIGANLTSKLSEKKGNIPVLIKPQNAKEKKGNIQYIKKNVLNWKKCVPEFCARYTSKTIDAKKSKRFYYFMKVSNKNCHCVPLLKSYTLNFQLEKLEKEMVFTKWQMPVLLPTYSRKCTQGNYSIRKCQGMCKEITSHW